MALTPEQQAIVDQRDALGLEIISDEAALPELLLAAASEQDAADLAIAHDAKKRQFADLNAQIKGFAS